MNMTETEKAVTAPGNAPETHLTKTETGWTLIHQGMPLLRENSSYNDCAIVAARFGLSIGAPIWIAKLGRFGAYREAIR
jgi:hypothetical protein